MFRYCQVAVLLGIIFFLACGLSERKNSNHAVIGDIELPSKTQLQGSACYTPFDGSYNTTFNDSQEIHMGEAIKLGFAPMATRRDTSRMKGKVVYYKPGMYDNFVVDSLPHSMPVMIPLVAKLIEDVAVNFRDSLKSLDYPDCKIMVTSITRTNEDIKQLRRRNRNAVDDSAHRFGTTFDISWINFQRVDTLETRVAYDRVLKKTLADVLYDLRLQERCYIKYEEQQKCFHITVRKK